MNKLHTTLEESQNKKVSGNEEKVNGQYQGHIEETPFSVILVGDKYRLTLGNHIIAKEQFETIQEAIEWIDNRINWELLTTIVVAIIEELTNVKEEIELKK